MSENIRSTNLRFNLEKDTQKQAWQYLQTMDKQHFKSYSNVIAVALVEYFERYYRSQDDPYFETREREYGGIVASTCCSSSGYTAGTGCRTGLGFPWRIIFLQADLTGGR